MASISAAAMAKAWTHPKAGSFAPITAPRGVNRSNLAGVRVN
ncbi:MAG TPA: hypothetical protein VJ890_01155 [Vineibacter sp.]|nr:hypothetical protein [Vineibacter sp.]